jgi:hypothetical protein
VVQRRTWIVHAAEGDKTPSTPGAEAPRTRLDVTDTKGRVRACAMDGEEEPEHDMTWCLRAGSTDVSFSQRSRETESRSGTMGARSGPPPLKYRPHQHRHCPFALSSHDRLE